MHLDPRRPLVRAEKRRVGRLTSDAGIQPAPLGSPDTDPADNDLSIVLQDRVLFDLFVVDEPC